MVKREREGKRERGKEHKKKNGQRARLVSARQDWSTRDLGTTERRRNTLKGIKN